MVLKFAPIGLALVALLAQPLAAQELITNRPAATPAPAAAKPAVPASPPAAATPPVQITETNTDDGPAPLPPNAPSDDYEFMGWCTGILTGHMQLFARIKPELDEISRRFNSLDEDNKGYEAQQVEGRSLLTRFRTVMATAEQIRPSLGPLGQASIQKGLDNWSKIDTVDKRTQAYSWMSFGLPEQCVTKVAALELHPYLPPAPSSAAAAPAVTAPVVTAPAPPKVATPAPTAPRTATAAAAGLRP